MRATPEAIAAAWATWKPRNPKSMGPGPAFREAIDAALEKMEQQAMTENASTPAPKTRKEIDQARVSGFAEGIERAAKIAEEHARDFERQADGKEYPHAHDALLLASDACELTPDAILSIMGGQNKD